MRLCEHCFSEVKQEDQFCGECGAPTSDEPSAESSDVVIYPELARANLFRLRGDFDSAEKVLLAILKRFPGNTTSQVLMADLNMERGDPRQALQWYKMAADISKDLPGLAAKMDRARAAIEREEASAGTSALEVAPARFPVMFFTLVAGILIVVSAGAFWIAGARAKKSEMDRLDNIARPISINQPASKTTNPPNPSSSTENGGSDSPSPGGSGMSAPERDLMVAASRLLNGNDPTLISLLLDSRSGSAMLSCASRGADEPIASIAKAGEAVLRADGAIHRVSVRLLDSSESKVIAIGTVESSALSTASGEHGSVEWATSIVSDFWKP